MVRDTITLGGGCFWCLDAAFRQVKGVYEVESGYAGGDSEHPTYEQVCRGTTGHAEVVRIGFDSTVISLPQLLKMFFQLHDPTTLNRQGADVGTQYRSAIFCETEQQLAEVSSLVAGLEQEKIWSDPIVTQVEMIKNYYPAEPYHQDYLTANAHNPYCQVVVLPKLAKFIDQYRSWIQPGA